MPITELEKLQIIMNRRKKGYTEIADATGQTKQNLYNKIKKNNFRISEYKEFCSVLGYDVEITLIDRETGERL